MADKKYSIGRSTDPLFKDFFSRNTKDAFHSNAQTGFATSRATWIKSLKPAAPIVIDEKNNVIENKKGAGYGGQLLGGENYDIIRGGNLAVHFKYLSNQINKQTWLFVNALASHAKRVFQDAFDKRAFGKMCIWPSLKSVTRKRRLKLGFIPQPDLRMTNRLYNSIKMTEAKTIGKRFLAKIYTDPDDYNAAYPEALGKWIKKNKVTPESDYGMISINGRTYRGRKGRIYAGVHNSRYYTGSPWRKFMGNDRDGTFFEFDAGTQALIDNFLFYGVFNVMNIGTESVNKSRQRKSYKAKQYAQQDSAEQIKYAQSYNANDNYGENY